MAENSATKLNMMATTDFFFSVCGEKRPENGEDSFVYALNESGALLGVFDGCGALAAAPYENLNNKTGAYLASRTAAAAYLDWFERLSPGQGSEARELKPRIRQLLSLCESRGGKTGESGVRLPSTAAVALCRPARGRTDVQLQWAGDSRVYLLDSEGLAQLTEDDPPGNLLCLGREFKLHSGRLTVARPGLLFAMSAGFRRCRETEMELEYLLLSTLQSAAGAAAWEEALFKTLGETAGDDYCLCGVALGFGSFDNLKRQLAGRTGQLYRTYIRGLDACSSEEKQQLREHYREGYQRLLCRR